MSTVFLVETDPTAPSLELVNPHPALTRFEGDRKPGFSPTKPLEVRASAIPENPFAFFRFAPGAHVVREDAMQLCEDFYWVAIQGTEPLSLQCGDVEFFIINIVDWVSAPQPGVPGAPPCPVDTHYKALLRIEGTAPGSLYCVSGLGTPMNEFKGVYDRYGFSGLRFTPIWQG